MQTELIPSKKVTILWIEQGTPEWDEARRDLYTGSNSLKLLKASDRITVTGILSAPYAHTQTSSFRGNYHTNRGHSLEARAIFIYEQLNNVKVSRPGFILNSDYPGAGYSPDGIMPRIGQEVKCFDDDKHLSINKLSDVPPEIIAQVHFGMLISTLRIFDLILYNPNVATDKAYKVMRIRANYKILNNLRSKLL